MRGSKDWPSVGGGGDGVDGVGGEGGAGGERGAGGGGCYVFRHTEAYCLAFLLLGLLTTQQWQKN